MSVHHAPGSRRVTPRAGEVDSLIVELERFISLDCDHLERPPYINRSQKRQSRTSIHPQRAAPGVLAILLHVEVDGLDLAASGGSAAGESESPQFRPFLLDPWSLRHRTREHVHHR